MPKESGQDCCQTVAQTKSPLIRPHNDVTLYIWVTATFMLQFPPPTFVSSMRPLLRFLSVWHFQTAQYPLTESSLTFGWLDTFSSGREFIINLYFIGPLSLKWFLEQTVRKANGKMNESHNGNVGTSPFWQIRNRKAYLWRTAVLRRIFQVLSCQIIFFFWTSSLTLHKEIFYYLLFHLFFIHMCDYCCYLAHWIAGLI